MRNVHRALSFLGLVVTGVATQAVACANTAEDCALIGEACPGQTPTTTSATGTGGGGGGNSICDMPPKDNPGAITDDCGVFVKSGAMGGDGTKDKPLNDLKSAVAKAGELMKRRIYACVGAYTDTLTLPPGFMLYGGFDCDNGWAVTEQRSTLKGAADNIPLTLEGDGTAKSHVESFDIVAVDATLAGRSSIAAVAQDTAIVHFESCTLTAGRGASGAEGASAETAAQPQPLKSNDGKAACTSSMMNPGGTINENACAPENPELPESSIGGKGGDGYTSFGDPGSPGTATPEPADPKGQGGQPSMTMCAMGGDGTAGVDGAEGQAGAAGSGNGTLADDVGFIGASGGDGKKGGPGQGGGGGGGQKGKQATAMKPTVCAGASGGAGGAGGCGGWGGKGGQAGGSSIALVSVNATITMIGVKLVSSKAGNGGGGGSSQPGALGGLGGVGGSGMTVELVAMYAACKGGTGGIGGRGGPGGGGSGGHSLGIAYTGAAPTVDMTTSIEIAPDGAGTGGPGGDSNGKSNNGTNGQATQTLEL
jgi:hypothetical protein